MRTLLIPIRLFSIGLAMLAVSESALSQPYPIKSVRFIVGGGAGGGADVIARPIAQKLSEAFGQQVIVDNRSGGGGVIAAQTTLSFPPDGYTMFLANAINMSVAPAVKPALPYDPIKDFAPVMLIAIAPLMIAVHPSLPVKSVKELVALAKARPGQVLCASNGTGTIQHLTIEMLNRAAGISLLHVPYKNGATAVIDTVSGQVQMIITTIPTVLSQVKASRLKAIATTGGHRSMAAPEIPTLAESGFPGFESVQWFGIFSRKNTPTAIIDQWYTETRKAIDSPGVKMLLMQEGAELAGNGPQALAEFQRIDIARWRQVVRESKLVFD
jgi:tripartite-type tricarboxylate transporter receptor subunit TctC